MEEKDVAFAQLSTEFDFYSDCSYLKLQSVFVLNEYRGRQIFPKINQHCIQFAKDQGHKGIKLLLYRTNSLAKKVYEKLGFK